MIPQNHADQRPAGGELTPKRQDGQFLRRFGGKGKILEREIQGMADCLTDHTLRSRQV